MRIILRKSKLIVLLMGLITLFIISSSPISANDSGIDKYCSTQEVNMRINQLEQQGNGLVKVHKLTQSPGGTDLLMLEIGSETGSIKKSRPAILVVGNMNGSRPVSTEAALSLAERIIAGEEHAGNYTWYILPMGNPDAYSRYFSDVLYVDARNFIPHNDDMDDKTDEDAYNDLDANGVITKMRVKSPEGIWLPVAANPRLMRKAEYKKGEKGIYKLYDEGIDDDGDGKYNEDGKGGTNVNINFPHLFKYFGEQSGLYAGSTPEVYELMKFTYAHPEIAMTFSFGNTNFLLSPPRGGRKGSVDTEKISVPESIAKMMGFDHTKTYSMKEIMEQVQPMLPQGMEIDEGMVASFLGLGAVVNPMQEDLVFYNKISEDYKEYLKDKGIKDERYDAEAAKDGSFELWSYYHLGLPVFSMDLWAVPKMKKDKKESSGLTVESLETMTADEFVAVGEEKVALFLKESGAPEQFGADRLIAMIKERQLTLKQLAGMMKQMPEPEGDDEKGDPKEQAILAFSDEYLDGKGFVNWKAYEHPTLGQVEIGGFIPFVDINPPVFMLDSLLDLHLPWVFELITRMPELKIADSKITDRGAGVFQIEIWIENKGFIPFVTAMGKRNKIPVPAIITVNGNGIELLAGKERTSLNELDGKKAVKFTWLIRSDKKTDITVKLESKTAGNDSKQFNIGA